MAQHKVGYIIGSLASASINRQLAKALVKLAPAELAMHEIPIKDLPLYSHDHDASYPAVATAFKQAIADAAATPLAQHGHAADLVFGGQPAGADRLAGGVARQHVVAARVEIIPFLFLGHLLLEDEHGFPDLAQVGQVGGVVGGFDAEIGRDHGVTVCGVA